MKGYFNIAHASETCTLSSQADKYKPGQTGCQIANAICQVR